MTEKYLKEWENLIEELSQNEIALYKWKEVYYVKSEEIITNTDFKNLYGKNNEKIRQEHVKNELKEWSKTIKELEFSIDYIHRRISFLRELIKCKRVFQEAKK